MHLEYALLKEDDEWRRRIAGSPKDTFYQLGISLILGVSAFAAFCILRPRWAGLYYARKRKKNEAASLPELSDSLFGWMKTVWQISEEEVLQSAGLDAFVFLNFFKMAIKFLSITLFFALVVIKPVHDRYPEDDSGGRKKKDPKQPSVTGFGYDGSDFQTTFSSKKNGTGGLPSLDDADYLWMYLAFAYFLTGLVIYFIIVESKKIIKIRQEYLGSQATVTDRTIRLSGIPKNLQSETAIKDFLEGLEIGKVESVLLCKDWKTLDNAMEHRNTTLRKLETAMTKYMKARRKAETHRQSSPATESPGEDDREDAGLLQRTDIDGNPWADDRSMKSLRPTTRMWYGRVPVRYKHVDAIDYYEDKLRRIDERVHELRSADFSTCPLAFVTMDSVASCQMAVQAVLDSEPLQLLANTSPAPVDVVWSKTYLPRNQRLFRTWSITALITLLSIFWSVVLVPIAGLIELERIRSVWPALASVLESNSFLKSLVRTQLPTLTIAGLNVGVPYLYSWLSYQQGMISAGDIELSIISKNFFFTFFNFFLVFSALGTAFMSLDQIGSQPLRETANSLATSIQELRQFYVNYIILQGFGLFPFRLLQFGSIFLYPFGLLFSKTPRDYAELSQPSVFSYGFYLPQTILIFLMCIVYSVLRSSWQVLLPGLFYFIAGHFVHKYQLLYSMDHSQHSTGKSWNIICDRVLVGLIIFQISMAGQLALRAAIKRSFLIIPLVAGTLWFSYVYNQSYKPLMTYIALKSIRKAEHADRVGAERRYSWETRDRIGGRMTVDETRETGLRFIHPNLIAPMDPPWVTGSAPNGAASILPSGDPW